jgi:hypothetical protein
LLSGAVTTPDEIVQQSDPEQAALTLSKGNKTTNIVKVYNILFILES